MSENAVLVAQEGGVTTLTLNRPEALNALNKDLMLALRAAVDQAADDDSVRAVVLTGNGRGFSSGADLASTGGDLAPGDLLRQRYHPVIERLRDMNKPVITAVNGVAAGAGMSLALAGDIVLAAESASFLQAFSKIGLVPDAGSTYFLPRLVGAMRARALAILADKISAADAQAMGMVWKVVPDQALQAEAQKMAAHLAKMPTRAYALIKSALNQSLDNTLPEQLEVEADLQTIAGKSEDFREGVAAFLAKRPPEFKGR